MEPFRSYEHFVIVCLSNEDYSLLAVNLFRIHVQEVRQLLLAVGVEQSQEIVRLPLCNHACISDSLKQLQFVITAFQFDNDGITLGVNCKKIDPVLNDLRGLNLFPYNE